MRGVLRLLLHFTTTIVPPTNYHCSSHYHCSSSGTRIRLVGSTPPSKKLQPMPATTRAKRDTVAITQERVTK